MYLEPMSTPTTCYSAFLTLESLIGIWPSAAYLWRVIKALSPSVSGSLGIEPGHMEVDNEYNFNNELIVSPHNATIHHLFHSSTIWGSRVICGQRLTVPKQETKWRPKTGSATNTPMCSISWRGREGTDQHLLLI